MAGGQHPPSPPPPPADNKYRPWFWLKVTFADLQLYRFWKCWCWSWMVVSGHGQSPVGGGDGPGGGGRHPSFSVGGIVHNDGGL